MVALNTAMTMLENAHLELTIVQTERAGHAAEIMESLALGQYDVIIAVSGDGLVHEMINGLLVRKDWE